MLHTCESCHPHVTQTLYWPGRIMLKGDNITLIQQVNPPPGTALEWPPLCSALQWSGLPCVVLQWSGLPCSAEANVMTLSRRVCCSWGLADLLVFWVGQATALTYRPCWVLLMVHHSPEHWMRTGDPSHCRWSVPEWDWRGWNARCVVYLNIIFTNTSSHVLASAFSYQITVSFCNEKKIVSSYLLHCFFCLLSLIHSPASEK